MREVNGRTRDRGGIDSLADTRETERYEGTSLRGKCLDSCEMGASFQYVQWIDINRVG